MNNLKNKHKGERCFIVCNGPSLTKKDLARLEGEITFGTNLIYLSGFTPTYYVCEDHLVLEDNKNEIAAVDTLKFLPETNRHMFGSKPLDNVVWMDVSFKYDEPDFPQFSRDIEDKIYSGGTVTYLCLQLAFWMGFKEVYLIGLDHSYVIPEDAQQLHPDIYRSTGEDPNHFDAGYFGAGKRFHDPKPDRMEQSYKRALGVFNQAKRKIANASRKSKLKTFQRVKLDELMK